MPQGPDTGGGATGRGPAGASLPLALALAFLGCCGFFFLAPPLLRAACAWLPAAAAGLDVVFCM